MGLLKSMKRSARSRTSNAAPAPSPSQPPPRIDNDHAPPPPSYAPSATLPANPPPYSAWSSFTSDTMHLPPPPAFDATHQAPNPIHNASPAAATLAHAFTASHPLFTPSIPSPKIHSAALAGRIGLLGGPEFQGTIELKATGGGKYGEIWAVGSERNCGDANLLSELPVYFAMRDSPVLTGMVKRVYYEVRVLRMRGDAAIALGYAGKPYPSWRLPGRQRGSLGVHGEDGRRFVNDCWRGIDFVEPFREGDTVGLGMRFWGVGQQQMQAGLCRAEVFFTRNGALEGKWRVDEERNAEREGGVVEGLLGEGDLYVCLGCFGAVEFEVVVEKKAWLYKGDGS